MVLIKLTGQNLGARQKELNNFIKNATSWDPTYNSIQNETSDVDMIFRIDLASKLKNIEFLISILKSGDSLHISRVLKHAWIFDMEYSNLTNSDYLDKEIFPFLSEKMKKKLITAVFIHIKDETRIKQFCEYCFETHRNELALKFLLLTPDSYKMQFLENVEYNFQCDEIEYMNNFVGNSFDLAKKSLDKLGWLLPMHLSRLYSVSSSKFLDIFENYEWAAQYYRKPSFGVRFTKTVLKNNKNRVLQNCVLYYKHLNSNAFVKNINYGDAQVILKAFFPNAAYKFWSQSYYENYKSILNVIPFEMQYIFMKETFNKKYPKEEFEMSKIFFDCGLYKSMPEETQEEWALRNIENNNGFFGNKNDYTWYQFVSFEKAFPFIKSILNKTNDNDKRHTLLVLLLESTKDHSELEILLKYFYERHINEQNRERFLESVLEKYTILEYNKNTFSVIDKLFHAFEVYNKDIAYGTVRKLRTLIILHHIVHDIPLTELLKSFIVHSLTPHYLKCNLKRLEDNKQKVFDFLMNYVTEEISKFDSNNYSDGDKHKVRPFLHMAFDILEVYDLKSDVCPEVIRKYAMLDSDNFRQHFIEENSKTFTQDDLLRLLKKDVVLLNKKLPLLNECLSGHLNILLRKLRIYFTNDTAREWLKFFTDVLSDEEATFPLIFQAVYASIALGSIKEREDLMVKYEPIADKIDHRLRKREFEYAQEGICRFIGYSRPHVPIYLLMKYIRGDYLRFCLPMLGMQVANLPCTERMIFVQLLLDKPVSIQKHGIRFAFKCFSTEELTSFVQKTWVRTRNVSLRTTLCMSMYKHLDTEKDENMKLQIINVIKEILLTVNADDDEIVYNCFSGHKIPDKFRGDFLEFSWQTLNNCSDDTDNATQRRKESIIIQMARSISLIREKIVYGIVEKFIDEAVDNPSLLTYGNNYICSKWTLVIKCLSINKNKEDLEKKLGWLEKILNACIKSWNVVHDYMYVIRQFSAEFITDLTNDSLRDVMDETEMEMISLVPMFETIIKTMTSTFDISVIYITVFKLKLHIALQNALYKFKDSKGSLPNDKADWQEVAIDMGEGIGEVIKQLVASKQYYSSLLTELKESVPFCLQGIDVYYHDSNVGSGAFNVFLAKGLLKIGILETNIFALKLLPQLPDDFEDDFILVVNEINQLEDVEVKCAFYNKYSSDHEKKKYN